MIQASIQQLQSVFKDDFLKNIKILKMIGEGAFAQVFLIEEQQQKLQLAAKKISLFGLCDYERKMVLNEAKILSSIFHPNIIRFHSCIYDSKQENAYIFMQYAKDGDLQHLINKSRQQMKPVKQSLIWNVLADISQGLNYLHENRIIHRDVKPANILISEGKYKLADMNVSKIKEKGQITTKTNVGTPLYTSPQVSKKQQYNEKCDVWSLGVVIYQLCCLRNPFNLHSLANLSDFNRPNSFLDYIPKKYSPVLNKCIQMMLERDPEQRIQVKKILQICQTQGLEVNGLFSGKADKLKTIVFPTTSKRWVNLIANKVQTTDSMVSLQKQLNNQDELNMKKYQIPKFVQKSDSILSIQDKMNKQQVQNSVVKKLIKHQNSQFLKLPKIQNKDKSSNELSSKSSRTSRPSMGIKMISGMHQKGVSDNIIIASGLYRNRSRTKDYEIRHSNGEQSSRNEKRFIKLSKQFF